MKTCGRPGELYRNAPVLFALVNVVGLLHLACRTLEPPAWGEAYTALFPLAGLGWAIWRIGGEAGLVPRDCVRCILLACVMLPLAALLVPGVEWLRSLDTLKLVFEVSSLLWFAIMALHCWHQRGIWAFAIFFVAGAIYGLALENGGIRMGFFSEEGYGVQLHPVLPGPLVTGVGWCTLFYTVAFITERITTSSSPVWLRAVLAAGLALSIDLQVDPVATRVGWWVWNPALPSFHHGVPLINYLAWACAVLPFAWHYFAMVARGYDARKRAISTLVAVPAYLVVGGIMVMSAACVACGPGSATMRLFLDAIIPGG